jgi:hypothetical protein
VWHALLRDTRFFERLYVLDCDLAERARIQGCPCGGRLHRAAYARKPRGGTADLARDVDLRLSFCCDRDGCRRRTTPPSLRFLGRRVYFGVVVVLVTAMAHGVTPRRAAELREMLGVDRRTLSRWRLWWRERFPSSSFWRESRARFVPSVSGGGLPGTLLDCFAPHREPDGVVSLLRFLAPF